MIRPKISMRLILLSLIISFFVADLLNINLFQYWTVCLLMIVSLVILAITFKMNWLSLFCFCSIVSIAGVFFANQINFDWQPPKEVLQQTKVSGRVLNRPALTDKQQLLIGSDYNGQHFKVLVNLARYPEYQYGDILELSGRLDEPAVFPDFNYKNYLKGRQVYLVMNQVDSVKSLGFNGSKIKSALFRVADRFEASLNQNLPEPEASFAAGLLLGSKRNLPDSLISQMQQTGTSHLVAISGYNITIIALVLSWLLLPLGRKMSFGLVLMTLICFVVLTGASASVVRGALISIIGAFIVLFDRRADRTNLLLLTGFLILIPNPLQLIYDLGYVLSFASFAGLIFLGPYLNHFFETKTYLNWLPDFIGKTTSETLAAQLFTVPILIYSVGKFSIIAPVPNLLILPIIPLAMLMSLLVGLFGLISTISGLFFGYLSYIFLWYPIKLISLFAKLPLSAYDLKQGNLLLMIGLLILVGLITFRFSRRYKNVVFN